MGAKESASRNDTGLGRENALLELFNSLQVLYPDLCRIIINYEISYVELGHKYRKGIDGVKQNHLEAFQLYQIAASQGDADGEANVAYYYIEGEGGFQKNEMEGYSLSLKGIEKENSLAYRNLGICYCYGVGIEKDLKEGIKLLRKGVELGNSYAQNSLGYCYELGTGVPRDTKEAVRLYRLGSEQGNSVAQNNLGACYFVGTGIERDKKEGIRLYKLAAEQGNSDAQFNLALCYKDGNEVEKDSTKAEELFRAAAGQGDEDAQRALNSALKFRRECMVM